MTHYEITNTTSGLTLGIYAGHNTAAAWAACCADAGYSGPQEMGTDIRIDEVVEIAISDYHTGAEIERRHISIEAWHQYNDVCDRYTGAVLPDHFGVTAPGVVWAERIDGGDR